MAKKDLFPEQQRAKDLLYSIIPEVEQIRFTRHNYISIKVENRVYRIKPFYIYNVYLMNKNKIVTMYCCSPVADMPIYDVMAAQYLYLKFNEKEFLEKANVVQRTID